jgi:hypothetical protein
MSDATKSGLKNLMFPDGRGYDALVAGSQLAKSWQALSALEFDSNESILISLSRLRV